MESIFESKERCCGCRACEAKCPRRAITMASDEEGFLYPRADDKLCVGCGLCVRVCPLRIDGNRKRAISRPSCAECRFTDTSRASDMTIADCFGIEKQAPELYDSRGVSLVIVNTPKGAAMLEAISKEVNISERPEAEITAEQQRLSAPGKFPPERAAFWETLRREGLKAAL